MKLHSRHILFLISLMTIFASYFFKISMTFAFIVTFGIAFLSSVAAFFLIAIRDGLKTISIFLLLSIITFYFRSSFEEWAVSKSYNSILTKNEKSFEEVNAILTSKKEDVSYPPIHGHEDSMLSVFEIQTLNQFLKESNVTYIRKDQKKIFYPIWGVPLDMDYGIFYFHSGASPTKHFKHLKGNWYFD